MELREGDRVRLKEGAPLCLRHPELALAVGVVSSIVRGQTWPRLDSSGAERARDVAEHVCFREPRNLVALNVRADAFEPVDGLEPRLTAVT